MGHECVGTTLQLLMKQSFGVARLENHRHNVAGEKDLITDIALHVDTGK